MVEGEAPTPRSGHSAVALPGERYALVQLCGTHCLILASLKWDIKQ